MKQFSLQFDPLRLDKLITHTKEKIIEWIVFSYANGFKCHAGISGGIDSLVLYYIIIELLREIKAGKYKSISKTDTRFHDIPLVFYDTGLEFQEIRSFVRSLNSVIFLKPARKYKDVLKQNGIPFWSKQTAVNISRHRNSNDPYTKDLRLYESSNLKTRKLQAIRVPDKFHKLAMKGTVKISEACCDKIKKLPIKRYQRKNKSLPMLGTKSGDSELRKRRHQCNNYANRISAPLNNWNDQDVWDYIERYNIKTCVLYQMGFISTGCYPCLLGIGKDKNRMIRLKEIHPKKYKRCMEDYGYQKLFDEVHKYSDVQIKY